MAWQAVGTTVRLGQHFGLGRQPTLAPAGKLENQRFEHLGVKKVTVPAGTFSAVCVYQNNPKSGEHAMFWLVKGIGVVKVSGKTEVLPDAPDKGPLLFKWTLKKFEPKGK